MRIFYQHSSARLDAADAPRRCAQKDDVALVAFDGEIFIKRADHYAIRLCDHGVKSIVRNRSATGDGGQTCTAAGLQIAIDLVAMEIGAVASTLRGDSLRQHGHD